MFLLVARPQWYVLHNLASAGMQMWSLDERAEMVVIQAWALLRSTFQRAVTPPSWGLLQLTARRA